GSKYSDTADESSYRW
nr:Chain A, Lasso Peptide Lihuanodin [Lihuaxuella thermophila]